MSSKSNRILVKKYPSRRRSANPQKRLITPCEKAHGALVRRLGLVDERYKANTADPVYLEHMALVNNLCSWTGRYVGRFSCMRSANLQSYLNWFVYLFRIHRDEKKWPVEESEYCALTVTPVSRFPYHSSR